MHTRLKQTALRIRPMEAADIEAAIALSAAESWPHRPEDWLFHLRHGRGWVACDGDDSVVGTLLLWQFGERREIGTLGLILVNRNCRGRGIGRQLMETGLEYGNGSLLRLVATEAGLKLYRAFGFRETGRIQQRQGHLLPQPSLALPAGMQIREMTPADLPELVKLDTAAFGASRPLLMKNLTEEGRGQMLLDDIRPVGAALIRRAGKGRVVGPLIAPHESAATILLSRLLQDEAGFVRIDIPAEAVRLGEWLDRAGLVAVDTVTAMERGEFAIGKSGKPRTFALVSQAFG